MDDDLKTYLGEQFGAIRTELTALDARIGAIGARLDAIDARFDAIDANFVHQESVLTEKMRDMQTELLRGFQAFSASYDIRMRKMEADTSNLNTSLSGRVNIVEDRLRQIEIRLGLSMLPPPPAPPAS